MRVIDAAGVDAALEFPKLVAAIHETLLADIVQPVRHHHTIERAEGNATHLMMPCWHGGAGGYLGIKLVNVFPGNAARGLPSVMGTYVLMSGETGAPIAVIDGTRLTLWKTAAASALAARFLAREDAATHLMVGAGALAPYFIRAHHAVRPIKNSLVWNKTHANAEALAERMRREGIPAEAIADLEAGVRQADIISTATLSTTPLVRGEWLKQGCHLDLVGAFTPAMRETDDTAVKRARLFCDIRESALKEGGDLAQPIRDGVITPKQVEADLYDLCRGTVAIKREATDITLFKSAGGAVLDLATAVLVARESGAI